jgi:DNA-binding IscR family transcriptional regulator
MNRAPDASDFPRLSVSEIRVLVAAMVLRALELRVTSENVKEVTNMNAQYVRNILRSLVARGLLKPSSPPRTFSLLASTSGRKKIYDLAVSLEDLLDRHPEVLDFVRKIEEEELRVSSKEELLERLRSLKSTRLGAKIIEKLQGKAEE